MYRKLPSLGAQEYAALVSGVNQTISEEENAWIKASYGAVLVCFSLDAINACKEESMAAVVWRDTKAIDESALQMLFRVLKAGGKLIVMHLSKESESELAGSLLMNGFINSQTYADEGFIVVEASKPTYKADATAIPLQKTEESKQNIWKLSANDFNDNSYELEDEEALLDDDNTDIKPTVPIDCETGKKKRACKNCSCGLKEMLEEEEKAANPAVLEPNASACGNCSRGDAFRCASCPYLGTPSFEAGTKPPIKVLDDGSKVLLDVQNETL